MAKLNRPTIKLKRPPVPVKQNKSDPDWYWNLIKGGSEICYVCGKPVKGKPHKFIGYHKFTGEKLMRHDYCEPGSARYTDKFGGYTNLKIKPPGDKK